MATSAVIVAERLRPLNVKCPRCGSPPRIRVAYPGDPFEERVEASEVILTYECHGRRCKGVFYPITAGAFLSAK